jgi:hypothetical protein
MKIHNQSFEFDGKTLARFPRLNSTFPATGVARNRGADFVQHLVPSRRARQNKALDPTAMLAG